MTAPHDLDPRLLEALNHATSLQLFQLSSVIERLLADPRRILAIRTLLHVGQGVEFLDWREGKSRTGKVAALKERQVVVLEDGNRRQWALPYAAITPPADSRSIDRAVAAPTAPARTLTRADFTVGERVSFDDRYLQTQVGVIARLNQKTASVDTGDGMTWRVSFALLRHVLDV